MARVAYSSEPAISAVTHVSGRPRRTSVVPAVTSSAVALATEDAASSTDSGAKDAGKDAGDAGAKDAGRAFGAHGGALDRLDAAFFTLVAGYYVWLALL